LIAYVQRLLGELKKARVALMPTDDNDPCLAAV
jgi:hypothetical protein